MKVDIDKEKFTFQVLEGRTIKELQSFWNCSRNTVIARKQDWGLVGLSPNSKKRDNGDGTKLCKSCGEIKSISDFYSNGYSSSGQRKLKPSCKHCEGAKVSSNYYARIIDILEEQNRQYACELCGYKANHAALTFHHHTKEKNFEISRGKTLSRELLSKEISICKLLCQNCHHEIHNPTLMIYYGDA